MFIQARRHFPPTFCLPQGQFIMLYQLRGQFRVFFPTRGTSLASILAPKIALWLQEYNLEHFLASKSAVWCFRQPGGHLRACCFGSQKDTVAWFLPPKWALHWFRLPRKHSFDIWALNQALKCVFFSNWAARGNKCTLLLITVMFVTLASTTKPLQGFSGSLKIYKIYSLKTSYKGLFPTVTGHESK